VFKCTFEFTTTYTNTKRKCPTYNKEKKVNQIGHILGRKSILKHIIEEKIEGRIGVAGRRGRRRKQPPDDLKETRGY
jgi:hypothetical protein